MILACMRHLAIFDIGRRFLTRLSGGGLKDLTLGGVVPFHYVSLAPGNFEKIAYVPEKLLNQVDVSEQHTTAAVAGESQVVQRLSVEMPPSVLELGEICLILCFTYPSVRPSPLSGSINLTYLVQRSPTTCCAYC